VPDAQIGGRADRSGRADGADRASKDDDGPSSPPKKFRTECPRKASRWLVGKGLPSIRRQVSHIWLASLLRAPAFKPVYPELVGAVVSLKHTLEISCCSTPRGPPLRSGGICSRAIKHLYRPHPPRSRHILISPHERLYAEALRCAVLQWGPMSGFRCFACKCLLGMPSSTEPSGANIG